MQPHQTPGHAPMTKRAARPQHARHVMIWDDDWEFIEAQFGRANGPGSIGASGAIRALVHRWVGVLRSRARVSLDQQQQVPVPAPTMHAPAPDPEMESFTE